MAGFNVPDGGVGANLLHPIQKIEVRGDHGSDHKGYCNKTACDCSGSAGEDDSDEWVLRIVGWLGHKVIQIESLAIVKSLVAEGFHGVQSCGEPSWNERGQRANRKCAHTDQYDI